MDKVVTLASPAKVNLHLDVRGMRSDGYHSLESIFQMVDFGDSLSIRSLKERDACIIEGEFDFEPSRNTIWKAVELFRKETGIRRGVSISVRKVIPCGSGTGGGSSNAASALRALDALFETGLGNARCAEIGAGIGSDVPFFCLAPVAFVSGRGEVVRPIPVARPLHGLLLYPNTGIATSLAYRWLDEDRGTGTELPEENASELIRMYEDVDPSAWTFFNSFFPVVARRYPELGRIREMLYSTGALYAQMSGSGSAFYALFTSEKKAHDAADKIVGNFLNIVPVKLLDRLPNTVLQ